MSILTYEIRLCKSCGLRYPLMEGHSFGRRCPQCLGETRVILSRKLDTEPGRDPNRKLTANNISGKDDRHGNKNRTVLLDNIRSTWNVGSILRTADGFGFTHAYLCGITPTPENEAVQKTALGAEEYVTWSHHKDAVKLAKGLKKEGWKILALEEDEGALSIKDINPKVLDEANMVLILGGETTGVDPALLELCDEVLYIPMRGGKRSFNVAIAFGIAAWEITEKANSVFIKE